jgi:AcrR family transcriptional regulator
VDQRRRALLEAAIAEIVKRGGRATMNDIAAAGGVTKPILYQHFGDRSGLVAALTDDFLVRMVPGVLMAFSRARQPKEMIRGAIATFVEFIDGNREVYRFLVRDTFGNFDQLPLIEELARRFAQVLDTGLQRPPLQRSEIWAAGTIGTVFTSVDWWLTRGTISRDDLVDEITELSWKGIAGGGVRKLAAEAILITPSTADDVR